MKLIFGIIITWLVTVSSISIASDRTKVGFVYVGPVGDLGWTYRHHEGLKAIEKEVFNVSTTHIENVSEGPAALNAITDLPATGHDIIYTNSFGFMDKINAVEKSYPYIILEIASGY